MTCKNEKSPRFLVQARQILLSFDHRRLSSKFPGLDVRLTGVEVAHVPPRNLV